MHDVPGAHGSPPVPGPCARVPGLDLRHDHGGPQRVEAVVLGRGQHVRHHLRRGVGGDLAGLFLQPSPRQSGELPEHQHLGALRPCGDPGGSGSDDAGGSHGPGGDHMRGGGHEAGLLLCGGPSEHEAGLRAGGDAVLADQRVVFGAAAVEHKFCGQEQHD